MDYLDPIKTKRHRILLFVGYVLVTLAIVIASLILLQQATNGYGIDKNGTVIQNGLLFLSSQPKGSKIYLNGKLNGGKTNARLVLPSSVYNVELRRPGYESWRRIIDLEAASVEHFDYALLIPSKLTTIPFDNFAGTPSFSSQSPDKRWLIVPHTNSITTFSLYDLKNPTKTAVTLTVPESILTSANNSQSWQPVEWADDNQHILLQHLYDGKTEYVMVDRQAPELAINLNTTLAYSPTKLTLRNRKYDQYYLYDAAASTLQIASQKATSPALLLEHVLGYQSYSDDTVLYVTDTGAQAGKVQIKLKIADQTYTIRSLSAGPDYLLNLTTYSGAMYVACGSSADTKAYAYLDPVAQIKSRTNHSPVPIYVFHVAQPNYLSFSDNAQFILVENGSNISVYDILNKHGYKYQLRSQIDEPRTHVTWMDSSHLQYANAGKLVLMDYDQENSRTIVPTDSQYLPAYSPDLKFLYALVHAPGASSEARTTLTQTSLLIPTDR